jgi:hypothetical protein
LQQSKLLQQPQQRIALVEAQQQRLRQQRPQQRLPWRLPTLPPLLLLQRQRIWWSMRTVHVVTSTWWRQQALLMAPISLHTLS